MATIISGKDLAAEIRAELKERVAALAPALGRQPGLSVILVGEDPASAIYVRNKHKAAEKIGIKSEVLEMPATASEADVIAAVDRLNGDLAVDAYLVQLPLPQGIDDTAVTSRVAADKDGDGLHPLNLGRLLAGMDAPRPCTPSGIMALLDRGRVALEGRHAVVVGRSILVGKPIALMLLERHATVTMCHSRTPDLAAQVQRADVVVAAVGKARLIQGDWIKPGAAVIDVGMNRVDGQLCGDVDFEPACERAGVITPVPGGVGPMTVAMLMKNTVEAAARKVRS